MNSLFQQIFSQIKLKYIYVVFLAGFFLAYLIYVPLYRSQISSSRDTLSKTLSNYTSLNETFKTTLLENKRILNENSNFALQNQQLLFDLDNYAEKCTLECNNQLKVCTKKIQDVKLQCIKRRRKK